MRVSSLVCSVKFEARVLVPSNSQVDTLLLELAQALDYKISSFC